jgi:hypothetical protein
MLRTVTLTRLGAWLGLAGLFVQVFLPIHIVLDIVEAAVAQDAARPGLHHVHLRAHAHPIDDVAGNSQPESGPADNHPASKHAHCPICSVPLHAAAAFMLPSSTLPLVPARKVATVAPVLVSRELASGSAASYASRAPPRSSIG